MEALKKLVTKCAIKTLPINMIVSLVKSKIMESVIKFHHKVRN